MKIILYILCIDVILNLVISVFAIGHCVYDYIVILSFLVIVIVYEF